MQYVSLVVGFCAPTFPAIRYTDLRPYLSCHHIQSQADADPKGHRQKERPAAATSVPTNGSCSNSTAFQLTQQSKVRQGLIQTPFIPLIGDFISLQHSRNPMRATRAHQSRPSEGCCTQPGPLCLICKTRGEQHMSFGLASPRLGNIGRPMKWRLQELNRHIQGF